MNVYEITEDEMINNRIQVECGSLVIVKLINGRRHIHKITERDVREQHRAREMDNKMRSLGWVEKY